MATTATSSVGAEATGSAREDGPVLSLINKRLRALRKKLNRIAQMEESMAQGKPIHKDQEEVLKSKPSLLASIDELEKLRAPLASALSEELSSLAAPAPPSPSPSPPPPSPSPPPRQDDAVVLEDLLTLLYFGSLFDVKSQGEFTATMLTRTHERGCCLTYDYVTDDATDLLGERDLDLISGLSGLLISRPADSGLSHKDALRRCIEHAKLWLSNSDLLVDPNSNVSYSGLRERLNKIMASDYFTTTPEMKGPVEMAAAAGNYVPFQVPAQGIPVSVPVQMEGSAVAHYDQEEEDTSKDFQGDEAADNQSSPAEELQKGEVENENHAEVVSGDTEFTKQPAEVDQNQRALDSKEQYNNSRRNYQNHRGGRGGGRGAGRGYPNGRGGRIGGRGGGGGYQNGRSQYYDQPGNYYPRNYYNNRGRGGRGGGHQYNNYGPVQGGHSPADVGVAS